jgi:hypothetical protein
MMLTEKDITLRLSQGKITLPPLTLQLASRETNSKNNRADAVAWGNWDGGREKFAVEFKALSTPKMIRAAMDRIKAAARDMGLYPMIIVPYLNEVTLQQLEKEAVSGIDLCGNGVAVVPNKLLIWRTGNPNQFLNSGPIKNIYRRNTSMVARVLLTQSRFARVTDIYEAIAGRNVLAEWLRQPMGLSTVSKALKKLEDDMMIGRENASVLLLQPEKLLAKLAENYTAVAREYVVNWQLPVLSKGKIADDVLRKAFGNKIPAVTTGLASVSRYAVMQAGEKLSIYCSDPDGWVKDLPGSQDDRFPNLSVIKTTEASVFFDVRPVKGVIWASPVQTYLELIAGDKRDQETALQVKEVILRELKDASL